MSVRVNGVVITAKRGLEEKKIEAGEKVDVFLYRIFAISGDKAWLVENKSLKEDSVVI